MAKLMRKNKKFGRCSSEGHGQDCHVSDDIQSEYYSRSTDKRNHLKREFEEMEDVK